MQQKNFSFSFRGHLKPLNFPCVMGIINLTTDSFYSGSRTINEDQAMESAKKMVEEGASVLDLGSISTRPGANLLSAEEELSRLLPALKKIRHELPDIFISVDTFRADVARAAADEGADIINDISGGTMDENMFDTVAQLGLPYVLMHIQGTPETMQTNPVYNNVVKEVNFFLAQQIIKAQEAGVHDIIIDPGFGFGKTVEHNFELLNNLEVFHVHNKPILAGLSRKSMIYKTLGVTPDESLNGTTALNAIALAKGAHILRVHDVKEAMDVMRLAEKMKG
jgi:dihydropteroate synthase